MKVSTKSVVYRLSSFLVSALFFATNGLFAYGAERTFWEQRRISRARVEGRNADPIQLAALPATAAGLLGQLPVVNGISLGTAPRAQAGVPAEGRPISPAAVADLPEWLNRNTWRFGSVRMCRMAAKENAPLAIIVEDLHTSPEAQKNTSGLLRQLAEARALTLVGVEGASGAFELTSLRDWPSDAARARAADWGVDNGLIGGAEHAGLLSDPALTLWGIEDPDLYIRDVEAVRGSLDLRDRSAAVTAQMDRILARLKADTYSPAQQSLDRVIQGYQAHSADLADYAQATADAYQTTAKSLHGEFPQTARLLDIIRIEKSLNFKAVETQRAALVESLAARLSEQELSPLVKAATAFRLGQMDNAGFNVYFQDFCRRHGVSLSSSRDFLAYTSYVAQAESMDRPALIRELGRLESAAELALADTPARKNAAQIARDARLLAKLTANRLSPEDWESYQTRDIASLPARLESAARTAGETPAPCPENNFPAFLSPFEDFCRLAMDRNRALADRLADRMAAQNTRAAALLVGGFHTEGLARLFSERGMSVLVFTPKVETLPAESDALEMFARKPLPLDQVFAGKPISVIAARGLAAMPLSTPNPEAVASQSAPEQMELRALNEHAREWMAEELKTGLDSIAARLRETVSRHPLLKAMGVNAEIQGGNLLLDVNGEHYDVRTGIRVTARSWFSSLMTGASSAIARLRSILTKEKPIVIAEWLDIYNPFWMARTHNRGWLPGWLLFHGLTFVTAFHLASLTLGFGDLSFLLTSSFLELLASPFLPVLIAYSITLNPMIHLLYNPTLGRLFGRLTARRNDREWEALWDKIPSNNYTHPSERHNKLKMEIIDPARRFDENASPFGQAVKLMCAESAEPMKDLPAVLKRLDPEQTGKHHHLAELAKLLAMDLVEYDGDSARKQPLDSDGLSRLANLLAVMAVLTNEQNLGEELFPSLPIEDNEKPLQASLFLLRGQFSRDERQRIGNAIEKTMMVQRKDWNLVFYYGSGYFIGISLKNVSYDGELSPKILDALVRLTKWGTISEFAMGRILEFHSRTSELKEPLTKLANALTSDVPALASKIMLIELNMSDRRPIQAVIMGVVERIVEGKIWIPDLTSEETEALRALAKLYAQVGNGQDFLKGIVKGSGRKTFAQVSNFYDEAQIRQAVGRLELVAPYRKPQRREILQALLVAPYTNAGGMGLGQLVGQMGAGDNALEYYVTSALNFLNPNELRLASRAARLFLLDLLENKEPDERKMIDDGKVILTPLEERNMLRLLGIMAFAADSERGEASYSSTYIFEYRSGVRNQETEQIPVLRKALNALSGTLPRWERRMLADAIPANLMARVTLGGADELVLAFGSPNALWGKADNKGSEIVGFDPVARLSGSQGVNLPDFQSLLNKLGVHAEMAGKLALLAASDPANLIGIAREIIREQGIPGTDKAGSLNPLELAQAVIVGKAEQIVKESEEISLGINRDQYYALLALAELYVWVGKGNDLLAGKMEGSGQAAWGSYHAIYELARIGQTHPDVVVRDNFKPEHDKLLQFASEGKEQTDWKYFAGLTALVLLLRSDLLLMRKFGKNSLTTHKDSVNKFKESQLFSQRSTSGGLLNDDWAAHPINPNIPTHSDYSSQSQLLSDISSQDKNTPLLGAGAKVVQFFMGTAPNKFLGAVAKTAALESVFFLAAFAHFGMGMVLTSVLGASILYHYFAGVARADGSTARGVRSAFSATLIALGPTFLLMGLSAALGAELPASLWAALGGLAHVALDVILVQQNRQSVKGAKNIYLRSNRPSPAERLMRALARTPLGANAEPVTKRLASPTVMLPRLAPNASEQDVAAYKEELQSDLAGMRSEGLPETDISVRTALFALKFLEGALTNPSNIGARMVNEVELKLMASLSLDALGGLDSKSGLWVVVPSDLPEKDRPAVQLAIEMARQHATRHTNPRLAIVVVENHSKAESTGLNLTGVTVTERQGAVVIDAVRETLGRDATPTPGKIYASESASVETAYQSIVNTFADLSKWVEHYFQTTRLVDMQA